MTGTGVGDSGISISAISRGSLEPAAEARMADSRKADALMAVTCHPICASHFCTFAQAEGGLHFCTFRFHPAPAPNNPYQRPEGRDLGPENVSHICTWA